ncbi:MAG: MarR family winged helix-turn-helix transcriptional regulator [Bacteroidota bacterium]
MMKDVMWTLDQSLGYLMVRTARGMKRALESKLEEHNLTATQYILLARLWEQDGISLSELGERLFLDNPTLTGIVDRMERDGLVERKRNDGDRRVVRVYLTPKGESLKETIGTLAAEVDDEANDHFTETQRQDLLNSLNIIWNKFND